jgi:hypothetical protein
MQTARPIRDCRYEQILDRVYDPGTQKYAP